MITFAVLAFLVCIAVDRSVMSRSVATLNVEQKAMLVDVSAGRRPWTVIIVAALLIIYTFVSTKLGFRDWLFVAFIIVLLAVAIPALILRVRRLSSVGLPPEYIRSARLSSMLIGFGLLLMFGAMVYKVVSFVPQ